MLSISNVASSGSGASYYAADNYYIDGPIAPQWVGEGAKALGLPVGDDGVSREGVAIEGEGGNPPASGGLEAVEFDAERFDAILRGEITPDTVLGTVRNGERKHQPGTDLTFSAPKSVTVMALVGGDKRLIEAQHEAVKVALQHVEKHLIFTRQRTQPGRAAEQVQGKDMLAAIFTHTTNRNTDPQLHTHAVIANAVRMQDGTWRSLDNSPLYENKMMLGALYRNELALRVRELGYDLTVTHPDGRFELNCVPKEVADHFSTRSAEIREAADMFGLDATNAKVAERLALLTRNAKTKELDPVELFGFWKERAATLDFDAHREVEKVQEASRGVEAQAERGSVTPADKSLSETLRDVFLPRREAAPATHADQGTLAAREAVDFAIADLSERSSAFGRADLHELAYGHAAGQARTAAVNAEIVRRIHKGELIPGRLRGGIEGLTPRAAVAAENRVIELMRKGKGTTRPIMSETRFINEFKTEGFTAGQAAASKLLLTSRDLVVGVQGRAGTGKTYMLERVRVAGEQNGFRFLGLAPTNSAAKTLEESSGIKSTTLAAFILKHHAKLDTPQGRAELRQELGNTVIALDEASLGSTLAIKAVLEIADAGRGKIVLVGDDKQLGAIEAGAPFAQLQKAGIAIAEMKEIRRQENPFLKAGVEAALSGNIAKAFDLIGDRIFQTQKGMAIGELVGRHYLALSPEKRAETLVVTQTRATRAQVNSVIRRGLEQEGSIRGQGVVIDALDRRDMTNARKAHSHYFRQGEVLVFNAAVKDADIAKGERLSVLEHGKRNEPLSLMRSNGEVISWKPDKDTAGNFSVYEVNKRELKAGDGIRWTDTHRKDGIINNERATVLSVSDHTVLVRLADGTERSFKPGDPKLAHFDYSFAGTSHAAQGLTCGHVIGALETKFRQLNNQQSFYVQLSRAKHEATLITDDKSKALQLLERNTGEKTTARELAGLEAKPQRTHTPEVSKAPEIKPVLDRDFGF